MTKCKILSLGLLAATMLATPAMAQVVYQEPGVLGFYPNSNYMTGGYGVRAPDRPGYYYGNRFHPAPRVGAFATEPWTDGSYYGYVEREY
jgi:hypothetical protein